MDSRLRACLNPDWNLCTARLLTQGITAADVVRGWHPSLFRWLVYAPVDRIHLPAGDYLLGDDSNPLHVHEVPPEAKLTEMHDEGFGWEPSWKPGYGPLFIRRSVTIVGEEPDRHPFKKLTTIKFVSDNSSAVYLMQPNGADPIDVTIELVNFVAEGWCSSCATIYEPEVLTHPYNGALLVLTDCLLSAPTSHAVYCYGRALLEDCEFGDDGTFVCYDHDDALVIYTSGGELYKIEHMPNTKWSIDILTGISEADKDLRDPATNQASLLNSIVEFYDVALPKEEAILSLRSSRREIQLC